MKTRARGRIVGLLSVTTAIAVGASLGPGCARDDEAAGSAADAGVVRDATASDGRPSSPEDATSDRGAPVVDGSSLDGGAGHDAVDASGVDATDGSLAVDAAAACATPCGLAPQCGCATGETCDLGSAGLACIAAGTAPAGAACVSTSSCAVGLTCIAGACRTPCAVEGALCGAPVGSACASYAVADGGVVDAGAPRLGCSVPCELADAGSCGYRDGDNLAAGCVWSAASQSTDCRRVSSRLTAICDTDADCSPGRACVPFSGFSACRKLCKVGDPNACGECSSAFATPRVVGGVTYGTCST